MTHTPNPKPRRLGTDTTILILFLGVAALALGLSTLTMPPKRALQDADVKPDEKPGEKTAEKGEAPPSYKDALREAEIQEARSKAQKVQEELRPGKAGSERPMAAARPAPKALKPEPRDTKMARIEPDAGAGHARTVPAKVLGEVKPGYPAVARVARVQGDVEVRLLVDPRGVPTRASVVSGPGPLREEALQAAQGWRFIPARRNGVPVAAPYTLHFNFRLA